MLVNVRWAGGAPGGAGAARARATACGRGYDYWLRSLVWEMKVRGWLLEVLIKGHLYTVGDG